jgi:hypothetical protein
MTLIRHCIIDTEKNKVVNIIEYETEQKGVPPGFESQAPHLLCVPSDIGQIGANFVNGEIVNPPPKATE